jgi:hypothetical protein
MALGVSIDTSAGVAADLAAAADVVVTERMDHPTRFELQLPTRIVDGDFPDLLDARFDPGAAMSIFAEDQAGGIVCLCSGETDGHTISLVDGGQGSMLTVTGGDVTIAMDREVKVTHWSAPGMTDGGIAMAICASYTIALVPGGSTATRMSLGHPLVQRKTDLAFINQLARRNNCQFFVRSQAVRVGPVIHTATFAPMVFADGPLAELRMNTRPVVTDSSPTTIDGLEISLHATGPTQVKASGTDIAGVAGFTADTQVAGPYLGMTGVDAIGKGPRVHRLTATGDSAGDLAPKGDAVLTEAQFFISAAATTTAARLGRVVRAHDTVRVVGAGSRHSGRYYVAAVTHRINDTAHTMDLELIRNAWGEEAGGLLGAIT